MLRVALAQINAVVGDLSGNEERIAGRIAEATEAGADLVLFPECAVTGYPAEDLLLREHFLRDARAVVDRLAARTEAITAIVGFPERHHDVFNSAAVLSGGEVRAVYRKMHLPNYGVFDEHRYFRAGTEPALIAIGDELVGLTVCEDIWQPGPPASTQALAGATLVVNISASPYERGKPVRREQMVVQRARDYVCPIAFCALVGGQDELVFDGHSFACDHTGQVLARAPGFAEDLLVVDVDPTAARAARLRDTRGRVGAHDLRGQVAVLAELPAPEARPDRPEAPRAMAPFAEPDAEVYAALVLGLRDYVEKNGFDQVVLGLSGGIDSTLVVLLAVDAVGADRVNVAVMPSRYSSAGTQSDARDLARALGIGLLELPIEGPFRAFEELLAEPFEGREADLTEENLQARIRGNLLMALSNKFGWLVLTTGNKSELSVGYSTLYGDTAGGFAVIKDVFKLLVYRLVELRAAHEDASEDARRAMQSIARRPPSAELRADQKDEDSLPPYALLDRILEGYVEEDLGREQLVEQGLPAEDVDRILRLVDLAEYKRRQNPPGIRITTKAFGRDRRVPITQRYRG